MKSVLIVLRERSFSSKKKSLVYFFSFCSLCFLDPIEGVKVRQERKAVSQLSYNTLEEL